jgi:hypothetical protein
VRLEASTKPHVHNLIHEFLINMTFTMACPNFKKGLKMVSGPLGVKRKTYNVLNLALYGRRYKSFDYRYFLKDK